MYTIIIPTKHFYGKMSIDALPLTCHAVTLMWTDCPEGKVDKFTHSHLYKLWAGDHSFKQPTWAFFAGCLVSPSRTEREVWTFGTSLDYSCLSLALKELDKGHREVEVCSHILLEGDHGEHPNHTGGNTYPIWPVFTLAYLTYIVMGDSMILNVFLSLTHHLKEM